MKNKKVQFSNSDFYNLGIKDTSLIKLIGKTIKKIQNTEKEKILNILNLILEHPENYSDNKYFQDIAKHILTNKTVRSSLKNSDNILLKNPVKYSIFGKENIDSETLNQMRTAMSIPIAVSGSLMPDAHVGYGIPIGGVLATDENFIVPYAVGVDIACRMCMSIYELPINLLIENKERFKNILIENTIFGVGSENKKHINTNLFDSNLWKSTKVIQSLKNKAYSQFGTSGAGNHFVEFGILEILSSEFFQNFNSKKFIALLSHSGSRNFGSSICEIYSDIAKQKNKLPNEAKNLSWLDISSEEGQEYWIAMNLAGEYSAANHNEIHAKLSKALNIEPIRRIENHHNFAWKEKINGKNVIVHRKGATPANSENISIIPGSMTQHGFIVKGKSNSESINSASHGAGRKLSRTAAYKNISKKEMIEYLREKGVELIGGDTDEAPMAYKDIDEVMKFQSDLVDVIAVFTPKIVRMAEPENKKKWKK